MTQVIVHIDERLLEEAQRLSGAKTKEEIIELALHELIHRLRRRQIASHAGAVELELTQEDLRRMREGR
ncbi:type II toxin-antitoxin system VapB family antitoxin [Thermoflexus hugenholtzii]|jgi:Uncharacterized protein conserved in bacteria (DUF2191).|uniref:Antitoxin of type II TA system, VapB n=1 Tax=Thermoflexus hugenholtzii JAD2 TaxID=877466 RepID=A0A212RSE6_9CHLR|nr:type II toxin-antitoxin system VapB family antitoxin [Thermoflexus hugenholtzii]SNB75550.1 antitoxin of type II TA system, VapB [Thermoflexus hugenholtzii JAD2]